MSAFHFVLNLTLIDLLSPAEYGLFAVTFATALIIASASNALFTVPLSVLRPSAAEGEQRRIERDLTAPTILYALVVWAFWIIGSMLFSGPGSIAIGLSAGAFAGIFALRTHARGAGYARFDASVVLRADIAYVLVGSIGLILAFVWSSSPRTAWVVLAVLSVANLVSSLMMTPRRLVGSLAPHALRTNYRPYWVHARWALLGAVSTMLAAQVHSLIISAMRTPEVFAPIAAGFVLFGPARVLFSTVQNVLRPEMARSLTSDTAMSAPRQAFGASATMVLAVLGLSAVVALFWSQISERLYDENYAGEPMGQIVTLWALTSLVAATATGPNALLQALMQFSQLSLVGVLGAVVAIVFVPILVVTTTVPFSILAVLAAEAAMAAGTLWLVLRESRRKSSHKQLIEQELKP